MEKIPLNFALLKNPYNWVIVWLMVGIMMYGLLLVFPPAGNAGGTPGS